MRWTPNISYTVMSDTIYMYNIISDVITDVINNSKIFVHFSKIYKNSSLFFVCILFFLTQGVDIIDFWVKCFMLEHLFYLVLEWYDYLIFQ